MRRTGRTLWLAAAISIAVAILPVSVTADQSTCQKGVTSPGASDGSSAGGVNIDLTKDGTVWWCPASLIEAQSDIPDGTNYPHQANPNSPNTNQVSHAISVAKLLTLAGIDPQAVGFSYVVRDN